MSRAIYLGVNIDHVATLRQARGTRYPDPLQAAWEAEVGGADGITAHLREDRRHIQDADIYRLHAGIHSRLNLEMALTDEMLDLALEVKPAFCCLVPEKRAELTTEGGLDVLAQQTRLATACERLAAAGIDVSLFIDADEKQIRAAQAVGAPIIELHTGLYAEAEGPAQQHALERLQSMASLAADLGLVVNAGHGLHYHNVQAVAAIPQIHELNIGHSIIARAMITGLRQAVADMKQIILAAGAG